MRALSQINAEVTKVNKAKSVLVLNQIITVIYLKNVRM